MKKHIIKLNINPATPNLKQPDELTETDVLDKEEDIISEKATDTNLEIIEPQEDIFNSLDSVESAEVIETVEELEELENIEEIEPLEEMEEESQNKGIISESLDDSEFEEVTDFF